jgi:nitrous oxide reductase
MRFLGPAALLAFAGGAGCSDFGGKAAVMRTAADETPCSQAELQIVSQPGQGLDGMYVIEGCGQRLTYQVTLSPRSILLLSRVPTGAH